MNDCKAEGSLWAARIRCTLATYRHPGQIAAATKRFIIRKGISPLHQQNGPEHVLGVILSPWPLPVEYKNLAPFETLGLALGGLAATVLAPARDREVAVFCSLLLGVVIGRVVGLVVREKAAALLVPIGYAARAVVWLLGIVLICCMIYLFSLQRNPAPLSFAILLGWLLVSMPWYERGSYAAGLVGVGLSFIAAIAFKLTGNPGLLGSGMICLMFAALLMDRRRRQTGSPGTGSS